MKKLLTLILCTTFSLGINAADFFVDGAIAASGDGLSWETAKKTIPEALTLAKTNNATSQDDNIYVKAGTYGVLDLTHVDCTGISLLGGYAVASAAIDISLRDITTNATILDGNATATVVKISQRVILDGFTIQNGRDATYSLNALAGGVVINHASALVSNCIIKNNVRATGNYQGSAGGVFIKAGTLRSCEVFGNSTTHANSQGGGIQITGGTIEKCKIYRNNAGATGQTGGVLVAKIISNQTTYTTLDANIVIANNVIYNNGYQGIKVNIITGETKTVSLVNNTVVNNASICSLSGAGISQLTATNNILYNNGGSEVLAGTATYNAIQTESVTGTGNIALASGSQATLFTAPTATAGIIADATSNWMPISGSGLYNVGLNSAAVGSTDIAGNIRIQQTNIDLGAYETNLITTVLNPMSKNVSKIFSKQGGLVIENATAYEIYTMDGRMQKSGKLQNNFVPMANGMYMVKAFVGNDNEITKVIVR